MSTDFQSVGLASGLNQGMQNFLDAYTRMKQLNSQEETQKQNTLLAQLKAQTEGYDISGGTPQVMPWKQAQVDQQTKLNQVEQDQYDPNSETSQRAFSTLKAFTPKEKQGLLPQTMSAYEVKQMLPVVTANQRSEYLVNSPFQQDRLDLQRQRMAGQMGQHIESDKILQQGQQSMGAADRGLSILNKTDSPVTAQDARVATSDLARIIQGGNPAQGTQHEVEYNTLYGNIMKAAQQISGNPTDAVPDNIKKQMVQSFNDLKQVQQKVNAERVKNLTSTYGAAYKNNPYAADTIADLQSRYMQSPQAAVPAAGAGLLQQGQQVQSQQAQDPQIASYAQQHGLDYNAAATILRNRGYGK